jgi:RES domain-containing protein
MPWRVFPWDPAAKSGEPFSPAYVYPNQGSGRFDLRDVPVLYLAETAVHAVAEKLQRFRGQRIDRHDLEESGWPLALVECRLPLQKIADLCDPDVLAKHHIAPDVLASRDLGKTQGVARKLHTEGHGGLRWWSALSGDWHTIVLFVDRVSAGDLDYGKPELLTLSHPAVTEAATALGLLTP